MIVVGATDDKDKDKYVVILANADFNLDIYK
jgi:hypothetical protein